MADPSKNEVLRQEFKSEFLPDVSKHPDERVAAAIECVAFQLGQINKKRDQMLLSSNEPTMARHSASQEAELQKGKPSTSQSKAKGTR